MRFAYILSALAFTAVHADLTPNAGGEIPTPANVVCYQEVVGSSISYAALSASLDTWQQQMYTTLGLTGPIELQVGHAQIPDRVSFENGCDGPYTTMADLFVHIQTTAADYNAVSASLEAYIAANPLTSLNTVECGARSITTYLPTCGLVETPTGSNPTNAGGESPTPANVICYQEVVGSSTESYTQVSADLDDWQQRMYDALGLQGPLNLQVGHAQIPDRVNFENGCDGPYATMADLFVHIISTAEEYDTMSAKLEAFIAANPLTTYDSIDCMARSVVTFLPRCGKLDAPVATQAPATQAPATQAPATEAPATEAPATQAPATQAPATQAPATEAPATQAPATQAPATQAPATQAPATQAPATEAPTTQAPAVTQAPATQAPTTSLPTNAGGETPTPENVVCYQEVVGSTASSYTALSASLDDWQQRMYSALGLTGPLELTVGHAQIPDRISFENGCDGPYATMADLFVHIKTTAAEYDAVSAKLEAFIAANPLTTYNTIDCMARSIVTFLPTCGKRDEMTPTAPSTPQSNDRAVLCYQEVVGTLTGTYAQVSAALDVWEAKAYSELGLSGPLNLNMGHAQIPDRIDFENGCNGPYANMADLFVYIPTTFGQYDIMSAKLEAFIAANPLPGITPISCSARSIVTELPNCGKIPNPPASDAGSPVSAICPNVAYTASITSVGAAQTSGKSLYQLNIALNTATNVDFIDAHITTSSGQYNVRLNAASSTSYTYTFAEYLAMGEGESLSYWLTTAVAGRACDTGSASFTTAGTPSAGNNPTATPVASVCPAVVFNHAIERSGAGAVAGTSSYTLTFDNISTDRTVEWVDVHIAANGGEFNYRLDMNAASKFGLVLPSPHLNLATGATVTYWFTYSSQQTACDSTKYTFTTTE